MKGIEMIPKIGDKCLVSTNDWFYGTDGEPYKAVFGTINGIFNDTETLGIKTNSKSTNWYLSIGNMLVAGCQIYYVIKCDNVSKEPPTREIDYEGKMIVNQCAKSRVYFADFE